MLWQLENMAQFTFYNFLHFLTDVFYVVSCVLNNGVGEVLVICWENPAIVTGFSMLCFLACVVTCIRLFMWVKQWVKQYINEQVFNRFAKLVAQNILDEQIMSKKK